MERSERLHSGDGFLEKNFTFPSAFGVEGKWALVAAFGVQVGSKCSGLAGHSNSGMALVNSIYMLSATFLHFSNEFLTGEW